MKTLTKIILIISFLLFTVNCSLLTAQAAIPHLINYQGRLTDKENKPLEGAYNLTFRIYDAETAGNLLWEETHQGVVIQKGIFGILLGSVTNLDLPFDKQYFLEIKVGNEMMSPRQRITSAGYAIRAEKADNLNMSGQKGDILYYDGSNWTKLPAGIAGQFLKTQGTGANPVWITPTPYMNIQVFTSSGTFIKPPNVDKVFVECIGGGGGGSGGVLFAGGGGGAGGYTAKICTLTDNVSVTVGAGGYGGGGAGKGTDGEASSFGSFCTANGGQGGNISAVPKNQAPGFTWAAAIPGEGGSASGGDINITGQPGTKDGKGGDSFYGFGASGELESVGYGSGGGSSKPIGSTLNSGKNARSGIVIVRW